MEITFESIVFLIFSLITLGGALLVVTTRNLFHAALYLMLSLFGVAGLFALLTAPFLAGVQVVVYIGAIAILIIFAVMLTPQVTRVAQAHNSQWIISAVLAVIFFLVLLSVVTPLADELGVDDWNAPFTEEDPPGVPYDSLTDLGEALVDPHRYMLPFEVASVLLMAALIGAVVLVRPKDADPGADQAD
ncbi:MAG: NADH-quinone oxidoreductase subunit J [Anaerolineae bacterium]|nr:NADH-quinone oxidoreductase subunit J [Anaerolineae bacterium]